MPPMINQVIKSSRKMIRKKTIIKNTSRKKFERRRSETEKKLTPPDKPKIDILKTEDNNDVKICKICKEPLKLGHL